MTIGSSHSKTKPILRPINGTFTFTIGSDTSLDNLAPIYPNPFNSNLGDTAIHIKFSLQQEARVLVLIQNPLGDSVALFQDDIINAGTYDTYFGLRNSEGELLDEGLYFITLRILDRDFIDSKLFLIEAN
jgi:hypothetical protein